MVEDKIALAIQDIAKLKEQLKAVKKDIKVEEKVSREDYLDLKKSYKELRAQIKDIEEEHIDSIKSDDHYNSLREERLEVEEKIAQETEKLYSLVEQLPAKPFEKKLETEEGYTVVQIMPEMRLYLNGREHRRL